jgi:signal transduction histidine kinase
MRKLISNLIYELRIFRTVLRGYLEKLADKYIDSSPELYLKSLKETRCLQGFIRDIQKLF